MVSMGTAVHASVVILISLDCACVCGECSVYGDKKFQLDVGKYLAAKLTTNEPASWGNLG